MKIFLLALRKLLLCDIIYYFLLMLTIVFIIIKINTNNVKEPNINEVNEIINSYNIDGNKLTLELGSYIGTYYFKTQNELEEFLSEYDIGDKVKIKGIVSVPSNNTIPNTFNYRKYLKSKKIDYTITIESMKKVSKSKNILYRIKNTIYKRIENIKDNEYMYAFVLGTSKHINSNVYDNYRINSVTHLFALSGLHVSVFSLIVSFLLKKFKAGELLTLIITSVMLFILCVISSYTPSILRASIFFFLSSINKIYYFYIKDIYLLLITFSILIFINPFYIYSLGFILSFTITFFILYSNHHFKINNNILSILFVSVVSFFGSLPIIINNFFKINIIGFINNLLFIPLVTYIIYPMSLIVLIFPSFSTILRLFTRLMEKLSSVSSNLLILSLNASKMNIFVILLFYVLLLAIIKYKKVLLVILFLLLNIYIFANKPNKNTCIYFLDVGQGDSIFIKTYNNKSILIDTGGKREYYIESWKEKNNNYEQGNTIITFLNSIGINHLDYMFITHGDDDHIGNSLYIKNNIKINNIYINKGDINYKEQLLSNNILLDNDINIDNISINSLNDRIYNNENDNSLVLLINIYNYRILLMGDASIKVEEYLLNKYDLSNIHILKIGHHGSYTSTSKELLMKTNPNYSIISVSRNNKYNHPSPSVINMLEDNNYTFYETREYGTISFCFDTKSVNFYN